MLGTHIVKIINAMAMFELTVSMVRWTIVRKVLIEAVIIHEGIRISVVPR